MKSKSFLKSKTVWVNVATLVAGVITFFQNHEVVVQNPDLVAALGGVLALINLGLRFLTDSSVTVK